MGTFSLFLCLCLCYPGSHMFFYLSYVYVYACAYVKAGTSHKNVMIVFCLGITLKAENLFVTCKWANTGKSPKGLYPLYQAMVCCLQKVTLAFSVFERINFGQ